MFRTRRDYHMLANELLAYESMNKIYRASAQPVAVEPRVVAVEPRVELIHYTRIESDYRIEHQSGEAKSCNITIKLVSIVHQ